MGSVYETAAHVPRGPTPRTRLTRQLVSPLPVWRPYLPRQEKG